MVVDADVDWDPVICERFGSRTRPFSPSDRISLLPSVKVEMPARSMTPPDIPRRLVFSTVARLERSGVNSMISSAPLVIEVTDFIGNWLVPSSRRSVKSMVVIGPAVSDPDPSIEILVWVLLLAPVMLLIPGI